MQGGGHGSDHRFDKQLPVRVRATDWRRLERLRVRRVELELEVASDSAGKKRARTPEAPHRTLQVPVECGFVYFVRFGEDQRHQSCPPSTVISTGDFFLQQPFKRV